MKGKQFKTRIFSTPFGHIKYALVKSKAEFNSFIGNYLNCDVGGFLDLEKSAQVTTFEKDGHLFCLVQVDKKQNQQRPKIEILGILIHEAVHINQRCMAAMLEDKPSSEFEAYQIQSIAQNLISAY